MDMLRQCELRHDDGGLVVSWIPDRHSADGTRMTLRTGDGERTGPVTVVRSWNSLRPEDEVRERGHDWSRTRKASDI